jgi:hypothetical protein
VEVGVVNVDRVDIRVRIAAVILCFPVVNDMIGTHSENILTRKRVNCKEMVRRHL